MYLQLGLLSDLDGFTPHRDDLSEALAGNIDWRYDLECALQAGCYTVIHRNKVLAIGGNHGDQCWFVTSEDVSELSHRDRMRFRKIIVQFRDLLLEDYPTLWNFMWEGNNNHRRFLTSIGAVFHDQYVQMANGRFQLFTIGGAECVQSQEE